MENMKTPLSESMKTPMSQEEIENIKRKNAETIAQRESENNRGATAQAKMNMPDAKQLIQALKNQPVGGTVENLFVKMEPQLVMIVIKKLEEMDK